MTPAVSATYRVQLHAGFTFDDAAALSAYLQALGVSHVYCSPYLQAARGSTHGYDVIDYARPNSELGGEAGFARFTASLDAHGLGQVLDMVPNQMSIATAENLWWADVLENGLSSPFASHFDVEWDPIDARVHNVVLLPVLGDHYGRVLEAGDITLARAGTAFVIRHAAQHYPVNPSSLGSLLRQASARAGSDELAFLADAFADLPRPTVADAARQQRRHRDQALLLRALGRVLDERPAAADAVDRAIAAINADPDALHALLEQQNFRLAWWRRAGRDLGYRRFFDINTLIGLRMEDPRVFEDTHGRVRAWVDSGAVAGLRVDHVDGLRDPQDYLDRLRAAAPGAWIVVEKILSAGERLPDTWPVAGTTGYDFLSLAGGLFIDPAAKPVLTAIYCDFTAEAVDEDARLHDTRLKVLQDVLGSDINRLTDLLLLICERHRRHRDYSRHQLAQALSELAACYPVYRTYVRPAAGPERGHSGVGVGADIGLTPIDRRHIERAAACAAARMPEADGQLIGFLRDLLLLEIGGDFEAEFVSRFQQLTPPATAKGVEDTYFYQANRFIALNELGGDPDRFGVTVCQFHAACKDIQARWPETMLTTSTHDTKRSEDVRARLAVLSEMPDAWAERVARWAQSADRHRTGAWPDRNTEYYFYQTLVGAWPISAERLTAHMEKATREARTHTSWMSPRADYEAALRQFVQGCLDDEVFIADVSQFVSMIAEPGRVNALAQALLKLTAPGIPDLYQGSELWTNELVDPDNRHPVDYDARRAALAELPNLSVRDVRLRADEGLPKLWVTHHALQLRRRRPQCFGRDGAYVPMTPSGRDASRVIAYQRGDDVVVAVPRLSARLGGEWADTRIVVPRGHWRDVLSGRCVTAGDLAVGEVWREFPVALLERRDR